MFSVNKRNYLNDSKHQFDSIEDSIVEEKFDDYELNASSNLEMKSPLRLISLSQAYNSDDCLQPRLGSNPSKIRVIEDSKEPNYSMLANAYGKIRLPNSGLENSLDSQNKILVSDQDQLQVIMERRPRRFKQIAPQFKKKEKAFSLAKNNYK